MTLAPEMFRPTSLPHVTNATADTPAEIAQRSGPGSCPFRRRVRVAHELPRRIRLKAPFLRHALLDPCYLEAHLACLPGVERMRCNPLAGSVTVRHDGASALAGAPSPHRT